MSVLKKNLCTWKQVRKDMSVHKKKSTNFFRECKMLYTLKIWTPKTFVGQYPKTMFCNLNWRESLSVELKFRHILTNRF